MHPITSERQLALHGGRPLRDVKTKPWPRWPVWDEHEQRALLEVLQSGVWSYNGPKERAFAEAFAKFIGVEHAVCVANGTVALQLALEACGIGLGDEVLVPGLTWQATAAAALDVNAVPILVDVCADTWCLDPAAAEAAITPRTKAILPVHLYGSMADMDALRDLADQHDLWLIEDCAHKHGGTWDDRKAGSLGDIGTFSFQLSKLMTAGEGGAVTTSDPALYEKLDALRNCGRRPEQKDADKGGGSYGDEGNFMQSGNYRITDFQAALLLEALRRLPEQNAHRDANAQHLNAQLAEIPGIQPMRRDARETREAYFNYAFRYDAEAFGGVPVATFRKALHHELGCGVNACYEPLNQCALYAPHTKPWRHRLDDAYWAAIDPTRFDLPECERAYHETSVCLHFSVLNGPREDVDLIAEAVRKVHRHVDDLR